MLLITGREQESLLVTSQIEVFCADANGKVSFCHHSFDRCKMKVNYQLKNLRLYRDYAHVTHL
jgi:hypothetical protein